MTLLRVIDFETTGEAPPAAVIEEGTCDLHLEEGRVDAPRSYLCGGVDTIPPEARAVHHIRLEDLFGLAPFDPAAFDWQCERDAVAAVAAHNMAFEAQWISPTLPKICTFKAALRVWPDAPSHGNAALCYWLEDQGLVTLDRHLAYPPHRAGPDAYMTAHILKALFATGTTGKTMTGWTKLPCLQPRVKFGKHKGTAWGDVPRDYLEWVLRSDLDADTKWNAQLELDRRDAPRAAPAPPETRGPLL